MQLGLDALYRLYETADGWVWIAVTRDDHCGALLDACGLPDVARGEPFADAAAHAAHRRALEDLLESEFRSRTSQQVFGLLDGRGVPCEIADAGFGLGIHDDPEMHEHGLVVEQQHPRLGTFEHFGTTIHFSDTPSRIFGPPPLCGQHTREILHEHGLAHADIDALVASGALFEELCVD